jgi:cytochrome o ubiquinol oxidase subunit 1
MTSNALEVSPLFGRLTLESFPFNEPIVVVTFVAVALGGAALLGALTYFNTSGANGSPASITSESA